MDRLIAILLLLLFSCGVGAGEAAILFVCRADAVECALAERMFDQLSQRHRWFLDAKSRGLDAAQSPLTEADFALAVRVITLDVALPASWRVKVRKLERWNDVPDATKDYPGARAALKRHLDALALQLDPL